jgi:hypothetical protein
VRVFTLIGVVAGIAFSAGCTAKNTQKALTEQELYYEFARSSLVDQQPELAAHIVASIVFASAPPCGPPPLGTLCADAGWRLWWAHLDPLFSKNLRWVPSPLDAPDPDLRIKIVRRTTAP